MLYSKVISIFNFATDNFCKQSGPRSGPITCWAWSGSKLFDTQMVYLKASFEKTDFEKNQQTTKKREKTPRRQRVKGKLLLFCLFQLDRLTPAKKIPDSDRRLCSSPVNNMGVLSSYAWNGYKNNYYWNQWFLSTLRLLIATKCHLLCVVCWYF